MSGRMDPECKRLLIRADVSTAMGTGHVMRCLALSQAWGAVGGVALLATALDLGGLQERLTASGLPHQRLQVEPGSAEDARATIALAHRCGARALVIDGYQFSAEYQRAIKDAGLWSLVVDDYAHADRYWANAILNQNLHASEHLYPDREESTQLLLGPRFALLRQEFWKWQGWEREYPPSARKVLVTLGGSDPDNATHKVIAALAQLKAAHLEVVVVAGEKNPHRPALEAACAAAPGSVRLLTNVQDMTELMAWADVAVSAGGSTSWELAFMGLPTLTLVLAENQVGVAQGLAEHGVGRNMGWHPLLSEAALAEALAELIAREPVRRAMGARGQELVDGKGGLRVVRFVAEATA